MDSQLSVQVGEIIQFPSPQPSPGGRGGRPRCLASYIDLRDRVDYGFTALRPESAVSIMDSQQVVHVGAALEYPPIGPLSLWERARVRGF
jgi:hypothetical protein